MRRESMTEASSLYTLSRRVGGNIGYALLATIVERRLQFHRAQLVGSVTATNPAYSSALSGLAALLEQRSVPPTLGDQTANRLLDQFVNQQAGMMAYNDASWFVGLLFLTSIVLVFLLPSRKQIRAQQIAIGVIRPSGSD